jgi:hypothetical protein
MEGLLVDPERSDVVVHLSVSKHSDMRLICLHSYGVV